MHRFRKVKPSSTLLPRSNVRLNSISLDAIGLRNLLYDEVECKLRGLVQDFLRDTVYFSLLHLRYAANHLLLFCLDECATIECFKCSIGDQLDGTLRKPIVQIVGSEWLCCLYARGCGLCKPDPILRLDILDAITKMESSGTEGSEKHKRDVVIKRLLPMIAPKYDTHWNGRFLQLEEDIGKVPRFIQHLPPPLKVTRPNCFIARFQGCWTSLELHCPKNDEEHSQLKEWMDEVHDVLLRVEVGRPSSCHPGCVIDSCVHMFSLRMDIMQLLALLSSNKMVVRNPALLLGWFTEAPT